MTRITPVRLVLPLAVLAIGVACDKAMSTPSAPTTPPVTAAVQGGDPMNATIQFGRDDLGSPFDPASGHDASGHSRDSLFPSEVVIDVGGTVHFIMGASGVHYAAIYAPGTTPDQIDTSLLAPPAAGCPPVPTIDDPHNRIAEVSDQVCAGGSATPSFTFTTPGKFLVICQFLPHFQMGMHGYVTVEPK